MESLGIGRVKNSPPQNLQLLSLISNLFLIQFIPSRFKRPEKDIGFHPSSTSNNFRWVYQDSNYKSYKYKLLPFELQQSYLGSK